MPERIPSDHPSVSTVRAKVERRGSTRRPKLRIPGEHRGAFPVGETVRLVVDGSEYHARIDDGGDAMAIRGAYDNARIARRSVDGTDRLAEWIRAADIGFGRSVLVDVVVPEFRYGVREPGASAVDDASEPQAEGLRDMDERPDG
jgi:hypothetical protein